MMECSTILLIYNEKDNIEPLTKNILKVYKDNGIAGEALLIDDGSEDGSAEICDRLAKKYKNVRVVHHPHNLGRSYAIQTGFKKSNSDVAIIMDGDYQYEPKEIPNFLKKVKAGYDVVVGAAPLSMNPFGMIISQNEGLVEVVAEKEYGEVVGIHFIGQGACEMAGQAVLAIQMEATLDELAQATFPHPTLSESLAEAARESLGRPIYLP